MQKDKIKDHSVQTLKWKKQTDGGHCITSSANAVGKLAH